MTLVIKSFNREYILFQNKKKNDQLFLRVHKKKRRCYTYNTQHHKSFSPELLRFRRCIGIVCSRVTLYSRLYTYPITMHLFFQSFRTCIANIKVRKRHIKNYIKLSQTEEEEKKKKSKVYVLQGLRYMQSSSRFALVYIEREIIAW